ncbi:hypothetical protein KUTeg_004652 [Tegillarca granosa]|uniref:Uncharacterized protein n=1 Tax=Tegillarca granosa TaxID=220873 RepID=A0ABQ9FKH4_TEGGR|nr:hypothetical protein KUTeg_004652 [Tegillarca granosa]
MPAFIVLALILVSLVNAQPHFDGGQQVGVVHSHYITEASGICASRDHGNVIYTHNDSGGKNRIFAIDKHSGNRLAILTLDGAEAHDWEDIACGPCPDGGHCVYVGDLGGNAGGERNNIYKFREPSSIHDQHIAIHHTDKLHFTWDQWNCETLMVAPDAELYIISKVNPGHHSEVVHVPKSGWGTGQTIHLSRGTYFTETSGSQDPVGGDISPDGHEVLVKEYGHVYYWYVPDGDYLRALSQRPIHLPHRYERQGEAVCWEIDGSGYYTLSEGANVPLYFYRRQ